MIASVRSAVIPSKGVVLARRFNIYSLFCLCSPVLMPVMLSQNPPDQRPRRVAVIGAGSLGSELCRLLARPETSPGNLSILVVDPDRVEARNLLLSPLFASEQTAAPVVGAYKAEVVVAHARRAGSRAVWSARCQEIADVGLGTLEDVDLLLSCTDSALARVETAWAARMLRLPMLDGGVRSQGIAEGRVTWFAPAPRAACYLCGLPPARRAEILAYALSPSLGCTAPAGFEPMSGTLPAVQAVAQAMLQTALTLLSSRQGAGPRQSAARILQAQLPAVHAEAVALAYSPGCPWHDLPAQRAFVRLSPDESIECALIRHENRASGRVLELPWPVCLRASCQACGHIDEPFRRTAYVRRRGLCLGCGSTGTLEPLESVACVYAGQTTARYTPRQLGLAADQYYSFRPAILLENPGPQTFQPSEREPAQAVRGELTLHELQL